MSIIASKCNDWFGLVNSSIESKVLKNIENKGKCSILLTGGSTAKNLYQNWSKEIYRNQDKIDYYFGDERCVSPEHVDSNYGMVMDALFGGVSPVRCRIFRMRGEAEDNEAEAFRYENELPDSADVLLLSMGQDGHVASMFPESNILYEVTRKVMSSENINHAHKRLTITPRVIRSAQSVFVFVCGEEKGKLLATAFDEPENYYHMPVRLTMGRDWLLDETAADQFNASIKNKKNITVQYV